MKILPALVFSILLFSTGLLAQSNYKDGINNLTEVKTVSEDLASAIQTTWDHETPQYAEAKQLYRNTQNTVNNMIAAFDARIQSGAKISRADVELYVQKATDNCDALSSHFNEHSPQGGTNSLWGIGKIVTFAKDIFNGMTGLFDAWENYQIKRRLNAMHAALDPCKLRDWEDIF